MNETIIQILKQLYGITEDLIIDCDDPEAVTEMAMRQQDLLNQIINDLEDNKHGHG